jgi:hypothetical protein
MLKIAAIAVALLVGLIVVVIAIGYALPKQHVAARAILLHQRPADVFALISNFNDGAAWRSDLQEVEILPSENGQVRFREKGKNGTITFEVVELMPPARLVTRIADKSLPFGGVWIFQVVPTAEGSRLNITENGEVHNPIFRFVSRFILGYDRTLDTYLQNVSLKFGERAVPEEGKAAQPGGASQI